MKNPRELAAKTIFRCTKEGAYSNLAISVILDQKELEELDRGLYAALVYTTLERLITIDYIISAFSSREINRIDDVVKNNLRIAICQLFYMDKIPESAIVNEAVELTPLDAKPFVNGVLRSVCRGKDEITEKIKNETDSIKYSVSEDILSLIKEQYPEEYPEICQSIQRRLPLVIRTNTLKTTQKALNQRFTASRRSEIVPETGLIITEKISEVATTRSSVYYIQGEPSQYAVELLDPKPYETVIDIAACPGGKAIGAAMKMENNGRVIAFDIHENKMTLLAKASKRLGINIIEAQIHDGREANEQYIGLADRVICDVPCSALGVINSKPEIRYKNRNNFSRLPRVQYILLENAVKYLKPGGVLVYSTCTINKEENEAVIEKYLTEHDDMIVTKQRTFMTHKDNTEGFFVCRMEKKYNA